MEIAALREVLDEASNKILDIRAKGVLGLEAK
jgi:hypothetical protein